MYHEQIGEAGFLNERCSSDAVQMVQDKLLQKYERT